MAFALLSLVALTAYLAADFWLPVLLILGVVTVWMALKDRRSGK